MNINTKHKSLYLMLSGILCSPFASAEIKWNGFASVRATYASYEDIVVPVNLLPEDNTLSFEDDSLFGLQAKSNLSDGLTATIQMVAEGRNDFDVEARWAYLSYNIDKHFTLHVGRMANPIFYQSEYELVGFAHDYARLPKSVYYGYEFNVVDGIAIDSKHLLGNYLLKTKTLYGNWKGDIFVVSIDQDLAAEFDGLFSFRAELSSDNWAVFSGVMLAEFEDTPGLVSFLEGNAQAGVNAATANGATAEQGQRLFDLISYANKDVTYSYTGFNWQYEKFFSSFEYVTGSVDDTALGDIDAWYLSLGYRLDDFTLTLRKESLDRDYRPESFDYLEHPVLIAVAQGVNLSTSGSLIDGIGFGVRYDFHPNAALKLDYFDGKDDRPVGLPLGIEGNFKLATIGVDVIF